VTAFFLEYGLFITKLVTLAAVAVGVVVVFMAATRRGTAVDGLTVERLNDRFEHMTDVLRSAMESRHRLRREIRARRKAKKQRSKSKETPRRRIFVLDFKGDLHASATASLREEITAILAVARPDDQVLVRLENAGGTVHEHGLAASQLLRVKRGGIPLLVAVDKVAASGGYLMACVADRIMAAPFAILGSIGVLAQLPNFHRMLERKGIDFEQITAGRFKRTVTMFGENTEEGRAKLKDELEEVHALFKAQIAEHRAGVDLERVGTGEHWYGLRALGLNLVDEIKTSDDFLAEAAQEHDLFRVSYRRRKSWSERFVGSAARALGNEL
jgi:serine protease SohB